MRPGPARIAGGNRRDGAFEVPAAGSRGRAGMFVLAAAAGLALATGVMAGTPAARAATAASARAQAAVHALPMFEPCPCADPACRPVCHQSIASGGPASMIHRHIPLAAAQAMFEPCPCDKPICRPGCSQSLASGGPASMIHRHTPLAAAQAVVVVAATQVNCPPPSSLASQDGNPGC
jgi:hypothetical protein